MPSWALDSPVLAVILVVAAGIFLLRSAPRLGEHRGRSVGAVALVLAMAAYANAYFSYLPQVGDLAGPRPWPVLTAQAVADVRQVGHPDGAQHARGAVVAVRIAGVVSGAPGRDALVYLPPQYFTSPTRRFPVLYLLHGSPGVPLDWFRGGEAAAAGLASARAGLPVILVAPRMSTGWLADSECVDGPALRAETYFVSDVIPAVDGSLRTLSEAAGRGVLGNSAGGFCALDLGLRHPDLFSAVAGLSPVTRPTYDYGSLADLFGHRADLNTVVAEHTPTWLLQHRPATRRQRLYLDVGDVDPLRPDVQRFAALDRAVGGNPQLRIRRGGHTYLVWRPALASAIQWFAGDL